MVRILDQILGMNEFFIAVVPFVTHRVLLHHGLIALVP